MQTVLIIEDYELNARLVEDLLRSGDEPLNVISAYNAEIGLELAHQHKPDLILMDLRIPGPGVDGWTATRIIRRDPELQRIPIVAMTAEIKAADRLRAFEAGCDAYITKPFDVFELQACVHELLHVNA
jgi:CheY-like chemotaxis protein